MDAMIPVDAQVGLLTGPPKYGLDGVIDRINRLAAMLRRRSGKVCRIQHTGPPGANSHQADPVGLYGRTCAAPSLRSSWRRR